MCDGLQRSWWPTSPSSPITIMDPIQQQEVIEFDPNFVPQIRARSNTWPLRPRESLTKDDDANRSTPNSSEGEPSSTTENGGSVSMGAAGLVLGKGDQFGLHTPAGGKKTTSRRNAWGNLSYADLITKAIENSPEKRLTLSQIYDWMVQNVPYFKDKGDSNSSAGWKNSIRHNLSLHSRFMRVQNEGTGKSSWWVINPDAKPGKTPRRRAASMDTKEYAKKRGRVKKKVEALRAAAAEGHLSPQAGSDYGDELDTFNLSPQDRARTSSNASSIGRLSPIQSLYEPDLHDNQVPPMSPTVPWSTQGVRQPYANQIDVSVSENLAELFLGDKMSSNSSMDETSVNTTLSPPGSMAAQLSPAPGTYQLGPPPPYPDALRLSPQLQHSPQQNNKRDVLMCESLSGKVLNKTMGGGLGGSANSSVNNSLNNSLGMPSGGHQSPSRNQYNSHTLVGLLQGDSPPPNALPNSQSSIHCPTVGENLDGAFHNTSALKGLGMHQTGPEKPSLTQEQQQALLSAINQALIRMPSNAVKQQQLLSLHHHLVQAQQERLSKGVEEQQQDPRQLQQNLQAAIRQLRQYQVLQQQQQQHQQMQEFLQVQQLQVSSSTMEEDCDPPGGPNSVEHQMQPSAMSANPMLSASNNIADRQLPEPMPNDLDLMSMSDFDPGELDCDVDQIIKDELSFGDMLDFSFDPNAQQSV